MTDYAAIAEEHRLDYGRKVANYGRILADMLYSDRTHFIYELLQNAEDAGADWIAFALFPDRLEVRHNGRPFNEADVRAICSIGEGTKAEDMTKIGKFGIGFKSVYAHTISPYIHSASEHFVIVDFVFPQACNPIEIGAEETLIAIPFNRGVDDAQTSYEHIAKRLPSLNSQTLLFLRSVQEIQWTIVDQQTGHYLRDTRQLAPSVRWVDILDEQNEGENWLIFASPIDFEDHFLNVEIAFSVETNAKSGQQQIRRVNDNKLVVFFPTEKHIRFGFVMQGPYRTTPSRDNILHDHPLNRTLIWGTARLISEAIEVLKLQGLLDANALDVFMTEMPLPSNWEFQPIYGAIIEAFKSKALLPTAGDSFVSGSSAKLARGQDLISLFDQDQLRLLFPANPSVTWLHESITRDRFLRLHTFLREQVKVEEITPEKLIELPTLPHLLSTQGDDWLAEFYTFLLGQRALWEYERSPLRAVAFVRLENGDHVKPFKDSKEPNAYLPAEGRETAFPIVRKQICENDEARKFLERLGLRKPDLVAEVLELILPKYEGKDINTGSEEEYIRDLEMVTEALTQANAAQRKILRDRVSRARLLYSQNAVNNEAYLFAIPERVVIKGGEFDFLYFDSKDTWYVHEIVPNSVLDVFKRHELSRPSPIRARTADWNQRVWVTSAHGWHVRGLESFDPDCSVDGLEHALKNITFERAELIWNRLLIPHKHQISGIVEKSTRQTFEGSWLEDKTSPMGALVRSIAWLPDADGNFHVPSDLLLEDLPEGFKRDEVLANKLGMRPSTINLLAAQSGIDPNLLKQLAELSADEQQMLLRELSNSRATNQSSVANYGEPVIENKESIGEPFSPPSLIDYEDEIAATFDRPGFVDLTTDIDESLAVGNPQRRIERTKEQIADAYRTEQDSYIAPASINHNAPPLPSSENIEANRNLTFADISMAPSVTKSVWQGKDPQTRAFLLQQYRGRCQICGETFPRRRDGQAYFEGIYMVQRSKGRWIDRPGNVLCLCANHAAQFLHGSVEGETFLSDVMNIQHGSPTYHIRVKLCGSQVDVQFTERHLIDLKALIQFSRDLKE